MLNQSTKKNANSSNHYRRMSLIEYFFEDKAYNENSMMLVFDNQIIIKDNCNWNIRYDSSCCANIDFILTSLFECLTFNCKDKLYPIRERNLM